MYAHDAKLINNIRFENIIHGTKRKKNIILIKFISTS